MYNTTGSNTDGTMTQAAIDNHFTVITSMMVQSDVLLRDSINEKADYNHTHSTGTSNTAGFTKLYGSSGSNTTGAMTQKATTDMVKNHIGINSVASSTTWGHTALVDFIYNPDTNNVQLGLVPHGFADPIYDDKHYTMSYHDIYNGFICKADIKKKSLSKDFKTLATGTMYYVDTGLEKGSCTPLSVVITKTGGFDMNGFVFVVNSLGNYAFTFTPNKALSNITMTFELYYYDKVINE